MRSKINTNYKEMKTIETKYVIKNDSGYFYRDDKGRWSICMSLSRADKFTYDKAQNVIVNAFSKSKQPSLRIEEIPEAPKDSKQSTDKNISNSEYGWLDSYYSQIHAISPTIKSRRKELVNLLSNADLELSDVYHFVKDNKPPAHVRTKVYGIEQEVLLKREKIKEELRCIELILSVTDKDLLHKKIENINQDYKNRTEIYNRLVSLM
jgi:hypothetical protein